VGVLIRFLSDGGWAPVVVALIWAVWRYAVIHRVTSTRYLMRRSRSGEFEIRPAPHDE
jgi:hypothetical protein